jgi:hypothetical protein
VPRQDRRTGRGAKRLRARGLASYLAPVFKAPTELRFGTPLRLDMTEDVRVLYDERACGARWWTVTLADTRRRTVQQLGESRDHLV